MAYSGTPASRAARLLQASSATRRALGASSRPRQRRGAAEGVEHGAPQPRRERGADARHIGQRGRVGGWAARESQQDLGLEQGRAPRTAASADHGVEPGEARPTSGGSCGDVARVGAGSDRTRAQRVQPLAEVADEHAAAAVSTRRVDLDGLDSRFGPPAPLDHRRPVYRPALRRELPAKPLGRGEHVGRDTVAGSPAWLQIRSSSSARREA